jgi:hypothetical protein
LHIGVIKEVANVGGVESLLELFHGHLVVGVCVVENMEVRVCDKRWIVKVVEEKIMEIGVFTENWEAVSVRGGCGHGWGRGGGSRSRATCACWWVEGHIGLHWALATSGVAAGGLGFSTGRHARKDGE